MKIKKISIDGVGGIKHLELKFNPKLNLICGTNGIGKTTILECICNSFVNNSTRRLKRNVCFLEGNVKIQIDEEGNITEKQYKIKDFDPDKDNYVSTYQEKSIDVLYFSTYRDIVYNRLDNLPRDPERSKYSTSQLIEDGISSNDIKSWFVMRNMWNRGETSLNEKQVKNIEKAQEIFSILDKSVEFSKVVPDTYDIMVKTTQGEIVFEYLSSGYRSCIYILLGIIKEIEYRYKNPYKMIDEFDGIILIDEIDVHLHPQWQGRFIEALKILLPNAQIIATTHSPTAVQTADKDEIIPLYLGENDEIRIRELPSSEYGYKGWSIEEILKYVMGIEETTTNIYKDTLKEFDRAIDDENIEKIRSTYKKLDEMLHPSNYLRKILQIQMAGLVGDNYDKN